MQYEDTVTIETPEGVDLSVALAGLGSRFVAAVIDGIIQGAMLLILFFAFGTAAGAALESGVEEIGALLIALAALLVFLVFFGYPILFETLNSGRTPGKAAIGIRVVLEGGGPVNFRAAAIRSLVMLVDMFPPTTYAVGIVAILVSKRNQRVGDMAAGTLIVRDRRAAPAGARWVENVSPETEHYVDTWDVSSVREDEIVTVRSFLARRYELTAEARAHLGNELAARLRPKVAGSDPRLPPEAFLEGLSAAKARRA